MKRYALDTNAVSALMKGDENVIHRLGEQPREAVVIPQPVVAEIEYGIQRLPRSRRQRELRERFALICSEIERAVWSDDVSRAFGGIKSALERTGEMIEDMDVAVAAHALAMEAVLVTANQRHMARVHGLEIEDWGATG